MIHCVSWCDLLPPKKELPMFFLIIEASSLINLGQKKGPMDLIDGYAEHH